MNNGIDPRVTDAAVSKPQNLLLLMRDMHTAAMQANWEHVDELNHERNIFLQNPDALANAKVDYSTKEIQEILALDKALLELTRRAREVITAQASITSKKVSICQEYESFSTMAK